MFFTVITPIYNVARFIKQGAQTVMSQSFTDFEWILVNDGSTDNSGELCEELAKLDSRVKVIHQENAGTGMARNRAIDIAQGQYVLFYDIDDELPPRSFEKIALKVQKAAPDVAVFSYVEICPSLGTTNNFLFPNLILNSNREVRDIFVEHLSGKNWSNGFVWNKAYSLEFLNTNKLRFKPFKIQQDEIFNLELYTLINKMIISSDVIYNYYVHFAGNASSKYIATRPEVVAAVKSAFLALANKWQLSDNAYLIYVHSRFIDNYLIRTLEKDVFCADLDLDRKHRVQFIQNLIENSSLRESIEFLQNSTVKFDDLFKEQSIKLAYNLDASSLESIANFRHKTLRLKRFVRRMLNVYRRIQQRSH